MARRRSPFRQLRRWAKSSVANAVELGRLGRLTQHSGEPYQVVSETTTCRLRRYGNPERTVTGPLVLVPPLMLSAEIYDVSPELSAVARLCAVGIDSWVVDFGAPEREAGGMRRTLDDHVRAVVWAVKEVERLTGRAIHLAGYSQGGMFAYQAAAYLRSEHLASLITFGSPVDIHKNLPSIGSDVAAHLIRGLEPMVRVPLDRIEGLPGALTSAGFKLLTPRKEIQQLVDFLRKLHDRAELERRESRRRFLGGEGFVAWPGPALVRFFEEFIVHNRLVSGGFVIDGHTLSLADIRCPLLYFLGARDDIALAPAIRAIRQGAPDAEAHEIVLPAGHFGLVVGSTALRESWPAVIEWIRWREGQGPEPGLLMAQRPREPLHDEPEEVFEMEVDYQLLGDEAVQLARDAWRQLGDSFRDASDTLHALRNQLPRIWRLETMTPATVISPSKVLATQAARRPEATFFLWKGRAFSYRDADRRVSHVARGLIASGIGPGDRVAVLMGMRPSHLSLVTALGRLGAVAVLVSPALGDEALREVFRDEGIAALATDPERAARATSLHERVLVLGGGPERTLVEGVLDMEAIDPEAVRWPAALEPDAGEARDLALVLVRPGPGGSTKRSRISNARWAFSALGVSSATTLASQDTVYCCLPLHHPSGIMVAVGGALVAGARLALATRFEPASFWSEVRRYGVTVVFYAGEMARPLVDAPASRSDRAHPVRLFAGSGMRADLWLRLRERFGVGVIEFYASTERNLVLANAAGEKIGALGRPLPGSVEIALVAYDFEREALVEQGGRLQRSADDEPGVALARVGPDAKGARRDVFADADAWWVTGDVLRRDADGDYWFVDRLANMVRTAAGPVATPRVEDALYAAGAEVAVVVRVPGDHGERVWAAIVNREPLSPPGLTDAVCSFLAPHERPYQIDRVASVPTTEGMRPIKGGFRRRESPRVLERVEWGDDGYRSVPLKEGESAGAGPGAAAAGDLPDAGEGADTAASMRDPGASFLQELDEGALGALVETMFLVAFADGALSDEERAHFERSVRELTCGRLGGETFEGILREVQSRLRTEGRGRCVEALAARLGSDELRQVALILASDMAAADGVLHEGERDLIVALAEAFGMDEASTREVLDGPASVARPGHGLLVGEH